MHRNNLFTKLKIKFPFSWENKLKIKFCVIKLGLLGNWTLYAVLGVVFSGAKLKVTVKFFGIIIASSEKFLWTSMVHQMYFNQMFWLPKSQCITRKQSITVNVLFIAFCLYHIVLFRWQERRGFLGLGLFMGLLHNMGHPFIIIFPALCRQCICGFILK